MILKRKIVTTLVISLSILVFSNSFCQEINELVVIDEGIDNVKYLSSCVNKNSEIIVLKSGGNQIEALTNELEKFSNLRAMHLIIDGCKGYIHIGDMQIDNSNISQFSELLRNWKNSFVDGGDILIYTCGLASNDNGKLLVRRLSVYTGLDVAASTDKTGSIEENADWKLEFSRGEIQSSLCFNPEMICSYEGGLYKENEIK